METMKDPMRLKLGGICSLAAGLAIILVDLTHWFLLDPVISGGMDGYFPDPGLFFSSIAANPWPLRLQCILLSIFGIAGFAVVPAVSKYLQSSGSAWIGWTSKLAYLGFAVLLANSLRWMAIPTLISEIYQAPGTSAATKDALFAAVASLSLDPTGFLFYGGTGAWLLATCVVGLRRNSLPRSLAWIGIAEAALFLVFILGSTLRIGILLLIGAGGGLGLLAPTWFIWVGTKLFTSGPVLERQQPDLSLTEAG
jgi:hypothetical protein